MLLKDGTTSKNMLPRGLTSLLDSSKNKASSAAGPAGPAGPAAAAGGAATRGGAASLQNAPFATPKHHATEGRNDSKNMLPRGLTSLLDSGKKKRLQLLGLLLLLELVIAAAGPAAAAAPAAAPAAAAGGAAGAGAASLQNAPFATPKHHATEGRNDLQKHVVPGLDVPSGFL